MREVSSALARFTLRRANQALRFAVPVLVICALLTASVPVFAQEVYGSLVGTVSDQRGDVIQGATVELISDQRSQTATTDSEGGYQFLNIQPGTYVVTVTATGFGGKKREGVPVELGRNLQVDFALEAGITETTVITTSDEPIVDVTSTKTATNVTRAEFEVIPKTLNFASVINVAPGTRQEDKGAGFQIDGASGSENVFIIDGTEVTRIENGQLDRSNNIPFDFVQEVQVKSAGFEAEYGGATGGVINVVTRGGTNDYHGEVRFEFEPSALRAEDNPVLRLDPLNPNASEYFQNPSGKDDASLFSPVFSFGGPIVKDNLWFYASYAPQIENRTRRFDLIENTGSAVETLETRDIEYRTKTDYLFGRLDWAPADRVQANVSFINSPIRREGPFDATNLLLPLQTSSRTAFDNPRYSEQGGFIPSWQLAGAVTYNPTDNWVISFRGGHTYLNDKGNSYDIPLNTPLVQIINPCDPDVFDDCAPGTTFVGTPTISNNFTSEFNVTRRTNLNMDATYVARFFGQQHILKGGYQINRLSNNVIESYSGGIINFYFDQSTFGERGEYGYYRITDFGTIGDVSSRNQALFIQDTWTVVPRLTVNLGLRAENEYLPAFPIDTTYHPTVDPSVLGAAPTKPIEFGWGDKIAPRVGVAWDVMGDNKLKVYGSFGFFYDTMKYELPRGSFGGDYFLRSWYTLDTPDFSGITLTNRPGTLIAGPIDYRVPSNVNIPGERPTIDPDLLATRSREYTVGADYAFTTNLLGSVRLTRKELDRTIEDVGGADAEGNEVYTIGNPGFGATLDFFDPATPKAVREYTGLEFRLDKRFANNWYSNISYIYSKLYGNYSGLASSDEVDLNGLGRTSPNVNRYFDLPELAYDAYGNVVYGRLATDRPHTFKAFASYRFNYGSHSTDVGGTQLAYSGFPISTRVNTHQADFLAEGRGDQGRSEVFTQTDLLITHRWAINERFAVKASFNVLNLWDERNATNVYEFYNKPGQDVVYEDLQDFLTQNGDYRQRIIDQGLDLDPRYLQTRNFQRPRQARFAVGFEF